MNMRFLKGQIRLREPVIGSISMSSLKTYSSLSFLDKEVLYIFISLAISSIVRYLGVSTGSEVLKYLAIFLMFFILFKSIKLIYYYGYFLRKGQVWSLLCFFYFYPLFRIFVDIVENPSLRSLIDGLLTKGAYYHLFLIGLGVVSVFNFIDFSKILYFYSKFSIVFVIGLLILSFNAGVEGAIRLGHLGMTNFLIPISGLVLLHEKFKKLPLFLGWGSLLLLLYWSSIIWSRSYTLVGIYLIILYAIYFLTSSNSFKILFWIFTILFAYFLGIFDFFSSSSLIREDTSIIEKFKIDSLIEALNNSIKYFDFSFLFYWEGNSRVNILQDAFGNFSFKNWIFGVGMFTEYESFVDRTTIEMGWGQETYRWGLIYQFILFFYIWKARNKNILIYNKTSNPAFKFFAILLLVKFLDGFVLGLAEYNLYNLFFVIGILSICIKLLTSQVEQF